MYPDSPEDTHVHTHTHTHVCRCTDSLRRSPKKREVNLQQRPLAGVSFLPEMLGEKHTHEGPRSHGPGASRVNWGVPLWGRLNKTHHQPTTGRRCHRGRAPTWVVSSERHHAAALGETISVDKVGRNRTLQQETTELFRASSCEAQSARPRLTSTDVEGCGSPRRRSR